MFICMCVYIYIHTHIYMYTYMCYYHYYYSSGRMARLRGTQGVPRKEVRTSVNMRVRTCRELRGKHDQTSCYLRPPTPWDPLRSLHM